MDYILMHRKVAVAEIDIDAETDVILKIGNVFAPEHIPVGISFKGKEPNRGDLNDWWQGRSIPASRQNFRDAMETLGVSFPNELITKCLGLSLSDQYWVNPVNNQFEWEKINFFDNPFSEDVGDAFFGKAEHGKALSLISPDNTSDGWLIKKWKVIDNKRYLIKGGSQPSYQEPYNEELASAVMRRLSINHVPYSVFIEDKKPYSICECFVTSETEFISAEYIFFTKRRSDNSLYRHFLNCCNALGIPNARDDIDKMLTLDYLIANDDRHRYNFGAIRNAETLEWLGIAPVFDSGSSLWNKHLTENIAGSENEQSKPFCKTHSEQIKLVKDFSWLNLTDLIGIDEEFNEILRDAPFINSTRRDALCFALRKRAEMLAEIVTPHETMISVGDVVLDEDKNNEPEI